MSKFSERARERIIDQLQTDPRLEGETVLSAATLTRASFLMLGLSGVLGFILVVTFLGPGSIQLLLGLLVGYGAYVAYILLAKPGPRVLGAFAVLTKKKVVLLGSSRKGVIHKWKRNELKEVEQRRRGNLLIMGKIAFVPREGDPWVFFVSNQGMGRHLVEQWQATTHKK